MNESLWLDEATTALVSKMSISDIFTKFLPGDFHPPLYYLLMKFWVSAFGNSEISLRIPSIIFALLTIYLIYKLSGKIAAVLLATAPLLFYYAQEARMYTMAMFLVTLSIFSFVKIGKHDRVGWWIIFSLSIGLIGLTDYVALLILPVFWIIGARLWKKLLMSHIILALFGILWLPHFIRQLNTGLSVAIVSPAWSKILGAASAKNIFLIPIKFMIGRIGFDEKWLYVGIIGFLALFFGYLIYKGRKVGYLYWLWLLTPLILGILVSFRVSLLNYYRFLFLLPAFYILIAKGIEASGKYKKLLLLLVLGINILCIFRYIKTPKFHREDWRGAAAAIGGRKIIFPSKSQKEALIYYGKGGQIVDIDDFVGKETEIWLSRYVWQVFDPNDAARKKIESLGYNKTQEFNFNGVELYLYENRN